MIPTNKNFKKSLLPLSMAFFLGVLLTLFLQPKPSPPLYDKEYKYLFNGGFDFLVNQGLPYTREKDEKVGFKNNFKKIKINMSLKEVYSILGKPQNRSIKIDFSKANSIEEYQWNYYFHIISKEKANEYVNLIFDSNGLLEIVNSFVEDIPSMDRLSSGGT